MTEVSPKGKGLSSARDVVCFSHLRWDFVYQRPQHLMSRFAENGRVFFVEEPIFDAAEDSVDVSIPSTNVYRLVPRLGSEEGAVNERVRKQIGRILDRMAVEEPVAWFYTPMMLDLATDLEPSASVYDCMDELSGFRGAPPELLENERRLFELADLVFTGGRSLYEAKKNSHRAVYAFPSSVDVSHFAKAREITEEPDEQRDIPHPRIGFAGVIDERMDVELLADIAGLKPDWHFVMIGPVVKISESDLPRRYNIHYLGIQPYEKLPEFLAGWDAAMMPFALNDATKFISPTKTPEYLSAGLGVVSTAITDVVTPYGDMGLVHIASTAREFVAALDAAMKENAGTRNSRVAEFLKENSWDQTFASMSELIDGVIARPQPVTNDADLGGSGQGLLRDKLFCAA
ncbi:MAG: glycosyltransferase family 1 protein [Acidobacteria bacterium]|nr:glycosyltransferase family 1 protein [Acidobacteriota bacterium]